MMEHLEAAIGEQPLADQRGLRAHRLVAVQRSLQAARVPQAHLLPQRVGLLERRSFGFSHRQRAVGEALRLLDLHKGHRLAQRLHHCKAVRRARRQAVELLDLIVDLPLRRGDVGKRHVLQPGLARLGVDEFRGRLGGKLRKGHSSTLSIPPVFAFFTNSGSQFSPSSRRASSTTI